MTDLCGCITCTETRAAIERCKLTPDPVFTTPGPLVPGWRYACEICGNKRCPHHTNHELTCTNSNEPGQKGSIWE